MTVCQAVDNHRCEAGPFGRTSMVVHPASHITTITIIITIIALVRAKLPVQGPNAPQADIPGRSKLVAARPGDVRLRGIYLKIPLRFFLSHRQTSPAGLVRCH